MNMKKDDAQRSGLRASLGLFDAVAVSVGAIIGGGIFVVTGVAAGFAGSAVVVSMVVAACVSLLTALSFCELAAWQPLEGSIYEYSYRLISPFAGFLTGWMWVLSNTFAGAAVALGFAYYFTALYPVLSVNIIAALIATSFTVFNYLGARESARLNNFLVVAKLVVLAFFVVFGLGFIRSANYVPFQPFQTGVLLGAVYIFFAYGGFARAAVIAEEIKDARRNVPRAILIALGISTVVYVLVGLVAVGLIGAGGLSGSNSPLRDAMAVTGNGVAVDIISVGGMLATASVLLTSILGVSRMAYAMARRRDLPQVLSRLHVKYNTPYVAVWIVGAATILLALLGDVSGVVVVSSFAMLFFYTLANVAAFRLRMEKRVYPRFLPAVGMVTCFLFLVFTFFASFQSWLVGVVCLIIGALYYFAKQKLSNATK